jgi:hypothetical protein
MGRFGGEERDVGEWEGVNVLGIVVEVNREDGLWIVALMCSVGIWHRGFAQRHR